MREEEELSNRKSLADTQAINSENKMKLDGMIGKGVQTRMYEQLKGTRSIDDIKPETKEEKK